MQFERARDTVKHLISRVYAPTFSMSFGQGMLIPTLPLFVAELVRDPASGDVNYTLVAVAIAMFNLGALVWNVPAGLLLTRMPERTGQLIGLSIMALTVLTLALPLPYAVIVSTRLVGGAGMSLWGLSRMQYMLRVTPLPQRGRVMSLFGGINRIGTFASPAVGGVIAGALGFGPLFMAAGAITATGLLATLGSREAGWAAGAPATHRVNPFRGLGRTLRDHRRNLLAAGAGQVFAQTIRSGRRIVLPLYAAFVLGLDATEVGIVVSASAAIDMTLFPLAGYVMDHFGRKFAIVPSFALFSASMALLSQARDFKGLILVGLLIGFSNGIGSGSMLTLGTDLAPGDRPSEFLSVWRLIGDAGEVGGPVIVGGVADLIGLMLAPLFLAGIGLAGALTFGLFVPETLVRRRATQAAEP